MSLSRNAVAFGLDYARLRDFVDEDDRRRADELVDRMRAEDLPGFSVNGVPVGLLARRELQRYYRGFVFDPASDPAYRQWAVTGTLLVWLSERWLEREQPEIVGICSGRTLATACAVHVARRRGLRVVTWDDAATFPDTLMFSHGQSATEVPLEEAWQEVGHLPLSDSQRDQLDRHLHGWSRSRNTPFPYNLNPEENPTVIRKRLGLRTEAPLVVAFSNACWDISVIDRDVGFESMFDWVFSLVEYARDHPLVDVVLRAHPAETNVPSDLKTGTPVPDVVRNRFIPLPENVKLVPGDSPISSYTLSEMAEVNIVYASRLGLEIAMRGKRPWVAGNATYRDKGFTRDLLSREHMFELLDGPIPEEPLSAKEVELAKRFAYLWFFRYEVALPVLRTPDSRFKLDSFHQLGPEGDPTLSNICDAFVSGEPFLHLGAPRGSFASENGGANQSVAPSHL